MLTRLRRSFRVCKITMPKTIEVEIQSPIGPMTVYMTRKSILLVERAYILLITTATLCRSNPRDLYTLIGAKVVSEEGPVATKTCGCGAFR